MLMPIIVKMSAKEKKYNIHINITNVLSYDWGVESSFFFACCAAFKFGCGFIFCHLGSGGRSELESVG